MANMIKTDSRPVRIEPLQPASAAVTELLIAFRDPDPDLDHIVKLITDEPALSAEILRRSNSVMYGGRVAATDVFAAVARIGMYEVYSALVTLNDSARPVALANTRLSI